MANTGGFFCCRDADLAERFSAALILTEGFTTYGGLAGRELETIAVGLREALSLDYQTYRAATVEYMASRLLLAGVPIVRPPGGHAIFIDAAAFCDHLGPAELPGVGLVNALYLEGGVRAVEIGTLMFGAASQKELVRLAFPRRVYTQSHFDYTIDVIIHVFKHRRKIPPTAIVKQTRFLRHFSAHL